MRFKGIGILMLILSAVLVGPIVASADEGHGASTTMQDEAPAGGGKATTLELRPPDNAAVGTKIELEAILRDGQGMPVKGAKVFFSSPTQFGGTAGEIDVDDAETNAQGIATIEFEPRQEGENKIIVRFEGNATFEASSADKAFVVDGGKQTYIEQAGVKISYLGPWIIVLVLGTVWSLYMTVMVLVARIASSQSAREGGW